MTSSEDSGLSRFRALSLYLHPTVAVVVPLLFLSLTFEVVGRRIVPIAPLAATCLPPLLFLVGAVEYLVGWWLGAQREYGPGPLLRELLVVLIAGTGIALALTGSLGAPLSAVERGEFWALMIALLLQWLLTHSFRLRLRDHLLFLALFEGRQGERATATYREYGDEAGETLRALLWVRARVVLLLVLFLAELVMVAWVLGLPLSIGEGLGAGAYLLVSLFALRSIGSLVSEQLALGEGAGFSRRQLTASAAQAGALLAAVCLAGIPIAAFRPLLSETLLARALAWLARLLASLGPRGVSLPPAPPPRPPAAFSPMVGALRHLAAPSPPPWAAVLRSLLEGLGLTLLVALALALLVFLLRPLFRRGFGLRGARAGGARALRYLAELVEAIAARLRLLLAGEGWASERALRSALPDRVPGAGALRRRETAGGGGAPERLPRLLVLRGFRRLRRWGERMGVRFDPSYAPLEYAALLAERVPEAAPLLVKVAEIFEEGVYSGRSLPRERLLSYVRAVTRVIRLGRMKG